MADYVLLHRVPGDKVTSAPSSEFLASESFYLGETAAGAG
jgi:hypothetical protein